MTSACVGPAKAPPHARIIYLARNLSRTALTSAACRSRNLWLFVGFAETPPVIGDDSVAAGKKRPRLLFPGGAIRRIAMDEHDRLSRSVVFVVELDVCAVFLSNGNKSH